jgi:urease accessory protein
VLSVNAPSLFRATRVAAAGHWPRAEARGSVTLAYDDRHRRRLRLASDQGIDFLLDLAELCVLQEGDGLALSDGTWIEVKAKPEKLLEITADTRQHLLRLAWHLGNRHLPAQIEAGRILIRDDHVIAEMLGGLGAHLARIDAPFTPERGAYDAAGAHAAAHIHGHEHG